MQIEQKAFSRRNILFGSALALLAGCPRTTDPTVVTRGSWVERTREIIRKVRSVSASSVRILESLNVIPAAIMNTIQIGYDILEGAATSLENALNAYESNGGDTCRVFAAAVAVKSAITTLARLLVANGFWIGIPMELIADSVFSLIDVLLPRCEEDAGFRSVTSEGNSELRRIQESTTRHLRNDLDRAGE